MFLAALDGRAATPLPPAPERYVEDQAGVLLSEVRERLVQRLDAFERETSSQIVVATYRRLPPDAELNDYANRLFQAWKIGQAGKDNGVLLLVFTDDRKLRIEVGYGLEGAIPDALAKRIIEERITPRFRSGDYGGGIEEGVAALIEASKGEYQGTGRTMASRALRSKLLPFAFVALIGGAVIGALVRLKVGAAVTGTERASDALWGALIGGFGHLLAVLLLGTQKADGTVIVLVITWILLLATRNGIEFGNGHRRQHGGWTGGWGGGGSGGWGSGGGFGGGGGFSGGGGRSGGGGASGGW